MIRYEPPVSFSDNIKEPLHPLHNMVCFSVKKIGHEQPTAFHGEMSKGSSAALFGSGISYLQFTYNRCPSSALFTMSVSLILARVPLRCDTTSAFMSRHPPGTCKTCPFSLEVACVSQPQYKTENSL